jgi:hypothetical protein
MEVCTVCNKVRKKLQTVPTCGREVCSSCLLGCHSCHTVICKGCVITEGRKNYCDWCYIPRESNYGF